jgi:hypothetical protein
LSLLPTTTLVTSPTLFSTCRRVCILYPLRFCIRIRARTTEP